MFGFMCFLLIVLGCLGLAVLLKRSANKPDVTPTPYTDSGLGILEQESNERG